MVSYASGQDNGEHVNPIPIIVFYGPNAFYLVFIS